MTMIETVNKCDWEWYNAFLKKKSIELSLYLDMMTLFILLSFTNGYIWSMKNAVGN